MQKLLGSMLSDLKVFSFLALAFWVTESSSKVRKEFFKHFKEPPIGLIPSLPRSFCLPPSKQLGILLSRKTLRQHQAPSQNENASMPWSSKLKKQTRLRKVARRKRGSPQAHSQPKEHSLMHRDTQGQCHSPQVHTCTCTWRTLRTLSC